MPFIGDGVMENLGLHSGIQRSRLVLPNPDLVTKAMHNFTLVTLNKATHPGNFCSSVESKVRTNKYITGEQHLGEWRCILRVM